MKGYKALVSSSCDDWATPGWVLRFIKKRFFKGRTFFDPCPLRYKVDGLKISWKKRNFSNPPYSNIKDWIRKGYEESVKGKLVVFLIPARVDTTYWHDYIFPYASSIYFIRGRLKFNNHKNPSTFPSAIIVFGTITNKPKCQKQ